MSQENVEVVRRAWEAFFDGDIESALGAFAPDVQWDVSRDIWGSVVGGGEYRGTDGILAWLRDLYSAWERFEMNVDELIDATGEEVITVLSARGVGLASGIEVEHHPASVATVRAGRIVRAVWFPYREAALEAAGLLSE
jgi:ketosteroid isomerase-like protein